MKILCISSIHHLPAVCFILESCATVEYKSRISYCELGLLLKQDVYDILFVSPNNLGYRLDRDLLSSSKIKIICTASTGTDHIDVNYCHNNNIEVICLRNELELLNNISSTSELAFGLMFSIIRNIPRAFESVKNFKWDHELFSGRQLNFLTAGIVGYGRLGKMFASYCRAFGMNVLISDPYKHSEYENVDLKEIFRRSNVVSLHVHLDDSTKEMINRDVLLNASGVYLINTSRGLIVNEHDVICALENGYLSGYATDVLKDELGDIKNSEIIKMSKKMNIIITPHLGGSTKDAQEIAYKHVAILLKNMIKGLK